ncbi:N1R/p28 family protein [Flamingopox virus FGPVKD09]|uniref:N1R/p28 family protein n=1 Tax=Flamingopox virus FGPVKD09 TaxID=2059380 RepID=A0A2H4X2R1_9POXV|nr:N1R/p28 family protein [Flamingopox virus FGPVKD09]AUD40357.1 N1R/p28 family protein [Flamingopox virus FGPVKD09]
MEIKVESIDNNFCKLIYDDIEIIMMKENEYINATRLCNSRGRDVLDWVNKESSIELINELDRINRLCNDYYDYRGIVLNVVSDDKTNELYVHRDLILHISHWISPLFSLKLGKFLNSYIQDSYKLECELIHKNLMNQLKEIILLNDNNI